MAFSFGFNLGKKWSMSSTPSGPPSRPSLPVMPPAGKAPWIYSDTNILGEEWAALLTSTEGEAISDVRFKLGDSGEEVFAHSAILCSASRFFRGIFNVATDLPQPNSSLQRAV